MPDPLGELTSNVGSRLDAARPSSAVDPASGEQAARELRTLALAAGDAASAVEAGSWGCLHLMGQGRHRDALIEAQALLAELEPLAPTATVASARLDLLRTIALAGSEVGEFGVALAAAQELAADPAVHADATTAYDAAFSLAVCLERMGDSWQALRVLTDVLERHHDAGGSFQQLYVLNGVAATALGAFHRINGIGDRIETERLLTTARDAAEQALALLDRFGNAMYRISVVGNLGEVLAYQGELHEAQQHLRTALEQAERIGAAAHALRVRASCAEWSLLAGHHIDALTEAEHLIEELNHDGPRSTRIRAHHAAYLAARALGRHETALVHIEAWERLERIRTTSQLRSQSDMYVMKSEAQAAVDHHRVRAEVDHLTGLGNRRRLDQAIRTLTDEPAAAAPLAVAVVDIDHFKTVNDELGHAVGDRVLVELAGELRRLARPDDVLVRYGGEEFVVLMPRTSIGDALDWAERCRSAIERRHWSDGLSRRRITVSVGVSGAPPADVQMLLARADDALYEAKRAGRNLVRSLRPGQQPEAPGAGALSGRGRR
jgi:diguanylate cyclase